MKSEAGAIGGEGFFYCPKCGRRFRPTVGVLAWHHAGGCEVLGYSKESENKSNKEVCRA